MKYHIEFTVLGMHCTSCETIITEELKELAGVSEITIDHKTGKGSLMLDMDQTPVPAITEAIKKAG